jgi:hypothetical protein
MKYVQTGRAQMAPQEFTERPQTLVADTTTIVNATFQASDGTKDYGGGTIPLDGTTKADSI